MNHKGCKEKPVGLEGERWEGTFWERVLSGNLKTVTGEAMQISGLEHSRQKEEQNPPCPT